MQRIGFIGLGAMGLPMASNLLKKGFPLTVHDVAADKAVSLVKAGAKPASSPKDAAAGNDVVMTMLPSSPDVEQAVLRPNGILEGIREGAVYIDLSTIDPFTTRRVAQVLSGKGVKMLDAPVTKGVQGARDGSLTLLVGGDSEVLESVRDVLLAVGSTILHMGKSGAGSAAKLANNMVLAAIVTATAEAVVFGAKAGVDPARLVAAFEEGSASSRALGTHIKDVALRRRFDAQGFPVHLLMKDLELGLYTAREMGMPLFLPSILHEIYAMLKAKGKGRGFFPEVITVFEEYAGVEARIDGPSEAKAP
ncbi:MAG: NAD(P)-dependent oxidoreductase [Thermodesulfobacteriota bacterium]